MRPDDARPALAPVTVAERIHAVDVLRGVAVLGILVINMESFGLPMAAYFNPSLAGGLSGVNLFIWKISSLFFLGKMMSIFSMLFGAGLVLMYDRFETGGRKFGGVYYRRILWLLLFGIAHGYLLWYGDILFSYALCGLLLFPLRRRSPRTLIILAVIVLFIGALLLIGSGFQMSMLERESEAARAALANGETITGSQKGMMAAWDQLSSALKLSPEDIAAETEAYRSGFGDIFRHRIADTLMIQTQGFLFRVFWHALGLMLLGMALMKLGVFSGRRSFRFYILMAVVGYGIGLPLSGYAIGQMTAHDFAIGSIFSIQGRYSYLGNTLVSLGHVSLVMIVFRAGGFGGLFRLLAAVGRTALSNYLFQSLVCTTIFYGYGLGLFNRVERLGLVGILVGVWILELIVSPLWLRYFRFGPAEWFWRTLTYWRRQPMRASR